MAQNTPTPLLSPKARFQLSDQSISKHRDMLQSGEFQRAIDFAVLQYNFELAQKPQDQVSAMRIGWSITAVQEFVDLLKRISEKAPAIVFTPPNDNLKS